MRALVLAALVALVGCDLPILRDPNREASPFGVWGTDCGSYQCPEGFACGNAMDELNPMGSCGDHGRNPWACCDIRPARGRQLRYFGP